jgi:hypothetical protein
MSSAGRRSQSSATCSWSSRLAREVGRGDTRAREAGHGAHGNADADSAEPSVEHRLAVRRAVEPHVHDRRCRPVGSDTPGDRLAQRSRPHAVPAEPAIPVSVRKRAASRHRPRVRARRALKSGADPQRRGAMRRPRPVDRLQQTLLLSAEEQRLRQLRRGSARRQPEQPQARDRQDDEGAAPSGHDRAVLPDPSG